MAVWFITGVSAGLGRALAGPRAGACGGVDKDVGAPARRQRQSTVAGQERFGREAVQGHHADLNAFYFECNQSALAAIDKAKSQPLIGARCVVPLEQTL